VLVRVIRAVTRKLIPESAKRTSFAPAQFAVCDIPPEVVRHQDVGVDDPAEAANGFGENGEKREAIAVAEKDVAAIVAT
jgi:hypothetical protein